MLDGDRNISMWDIYIYYSERLILIKKKKKEKIRIRLYIYIARNT